MKNRTKQIILVSLAILLPILSSCFTFLSIDQPTTANVGDTITVPMEIRTEGTDTNGHYGIMGFLIPNDWTVNSISFSGDYGPDEGSFLHPDSIDGDPGGQVDFWTDSLEAQYPSGDDMMWIVFQSNNPWVASLDTAYVDAEAELTVGNTNGTYNIGYFVTDAALDFGDPSYYAISLDNEIVVTGGTAVNLNEVVPNSYKLSQNYPNPFNPSTTISYELAKAGKATLTVYNVLGNEVATLVNGFQNSGAHKVVFDATNLNSGVYYYKLEAGDFVSTRKLIFMK